MNRVVFTWMLCIGCFSTATAQQKCDIHIDVSVLEAHNGQPVFPVVVHIDELKATYETNEQGKLVIDSLCPGKYTFHLHAIGHEHYAEQVNVITSVQLKFELSHEEHYLNVADVHGKKANDILQDKDQVSKAELAANSGKVLADVLQEVNGVSMIANGATIAKPVIHGLHSNRIVMMNNGIRQEDQQWGGEHAPNIDPFMADKITVVKGAASVRYGADAIGGVVSVEPKPLLQNGGWEGELNMAAFSNNRMGVTSGMIGHNFEMVKPLSFRLQGTYKQGGNYRVPGAWVANTGVQEANYTATVGWKEHHYGLELFYSHFNTDLGIYRGAHIGNQADLNAAIASDKPLVLATFTYDLNRPRQHVEHDLYKAKLYVDSKLGMWHATYAFQKNYRQEYDVLRKENDKAQMNLTLNTQTLNLNLEHRNIGKLKGEVGVDGIYQENYIQPGDRIFIPNFRSYSGAGYLIERYKLSDWNLEAGVRYDYRWYNLFNPEGNAGQVVKYELAYRNLSWTLGAQKALGDKWSSNIILSNAWRAPQSNELFSSGLHHGAARVEYGNKALEPERSYNLNLELKGNITNRLTTDISLYTQHIQNFIYLEPGVDLLTIRGYFKTFNYKQTNAQLSGIDFSTAYSWTDKLRSDFKASFLFARDVSNKDWLILMPADRLRLNTKYTLDISKKLRETYINVEGRYVFNQWRRPSNFDQIDYPRPPAAYFLLGASFGTTFYAGKQPINVSLSAMNILNQRYRDYLDAFRYFIDQPGSNYVLRLRIPILINNKQIQNEIL